MSYNIQLCILCIICSLDVSTKDEILQYENKDLESVVSPVKADLLIRLLKETNYDREEIEFLERSFRDGFNLEYQGPTERKSEAPNLPLTVGSKVDLWNKIMKEVKVKRVAGPYKNPPFESYIQSPGGLVPKAGGDGKQTRLIFHLSYDFKKEEMFSVNHHMPREQCSVKYKDLDYAVQAYLRVLNGETDVTDKYLSRNNLEQKWRRNFSDHRKAGKFVFAGKSDLKSAFRLLGLSKDSWPWLIFKAQDPSTGDWCFFIDKCLPFGASISCAHFQRFSNALCHIFEAQTSTQGQITNYLDDFLFLALTLCRCNYLINSFLKLCDRLGIPISIEKTEWGSLVVTFLGILLDGRSFCLGLPQEKHQRAVDMLTRIQDKKKATVKELQSLCEFLNFIRRVIFPGRTFTRRMYSKFSGLMALPGLPHERSAGKSKLKQHHHV